MKKIEKNKKTLRRLLLVLVAVFVLAGAAETSVQAASSPTCKTLYNAVKSKASSGVKKTTKKSKCTFLTSKYRNYLKDFYYATDSDQVYVVCIVKADTTSHAKSIKTQFDTTLKSQKNNSYLSSSQKKVVKAAKTGRSGKYVWYISLSTSSSTNNKAVTALKAKL